MKIGFIGCGKMAAALIKGVLKSRLCKPADITISDVHAPSAEKLRAETGVSSVLSNAEVLGASDIIILAVKPGDALAAIQGVTTQQMESSMRWAWQSVLAKHELGAFVEALDRKHALKDALQPEIFSGLRLFVRLQKLLVRSLLDLNEVRNLKDLLNSPETPPDAVVALNHRHDLCSVCFVSNNLKPSANQNGLSIACDQRINQRIGQQIYRQTGPSAHRFARSSMTRTREWGSVISINAWFPLTVKK